MLPIPLLESASTSSTTGGSHDIRRCRYSLTRKSDRRPAVLKRHVRNLLAVASICGRVSAVVDKHVFFKELPPVYSEPRTLVLAEDPDAARGQYSLLLTELLDRNHKIAYAPLNMKNTPLFAYGERIYEHVLLIPGTASFPSSAVKPPGYRSTQKELEIQGQQRGKANPTANLSVTEMLKFIDAGGNVLFFGSKPSPDMRKFANECGVDFHKGSTAVWDFFSESGNTIQGRIRPEASAVVGQFDADGNPQLQAGEDTVSFEGLSHSVASSQLTFNIVSGSGSAFVTPDAGGKKEPIVVGEAVSLVSAMQARNSARVVFAGSDSLCADDSEENANFCRELVKWTFRERGVLRMGNLHSHKVGENVQPYMYRVLDEITFNIDIEEYRDGTWRPFRRSDIQLEFVMLDPYLRMFLDPPAKDGSSITYSKTFKSPDVYGVFKFKIDYARIGYNRLHVEDLAPVRNFKHNDYERFIWCASPYYATCLLVPVSLLFFTAAFLYHKEDLKSGGKLL
ncbi:unnamed protein product [Amoebophrya sp. A120]|nr:unnamed protein product [Amoebophrya sp. A120]|eukprot:GSA120T00003628001.1